MPLLQVIQTRKYSVFEENKSSPSLTATESPIAPSTKSIVTQTAVETIMDIEGAILTALTAGDIADSHEWAASQKIDPQAVVGALKSLLTDAYVATEDLATSFFEFTDEAAAVVKDGSPEFRVLTAIQQSSGSMSMPDLQTAVGKDVAKIGMANAMKVKWIKKDGANLVAAVESAADEVRAQLQAIQTAKFAVDAVDNKVRSGAHGYMERV